LADQRPGSHGRHVSAARDQTAVRAEARGPGPVVAMTTMRLGSKGSGTAGKSPSVGAVVMAPGGGPRMAARRGGANSRLPGPLMSQRPRLPKRPRTPKCPCVPERAGVSVGPVTGQPDRPVVATMPKRSAVTERPSVPKGPGVPQGPGVPKGPGVPESPMMGYEGMVAAEPSRALSQRGPGAKHDRAADHQHEQRAQQSPAGHEGSQGPRS
jgi:hypothetical protein